MALITTEEEDEVEEETEEGWGGRDFWVTKEEENKKYKGERKHRDIACSGGTKEDWVARGEGGCEKKKKICEERITC